MRMIDADALKERMGKEHFHNYGYAIMMVNEAPTVSDNNVGYKTETISRMWIHESIRTCGVTQAYSRCSVCRGTVDGYVNHRHCPHCGVRMER